MIQSPLNYTGGKFKLLSKILPIFPKKIKRFFDVFCGGCNVGINVDCAEVCFIDNDKHLIYMYQTFQNLELETVVAWIHDIISQYGLSLVSRDGYDFYGCESSSGLGAHNREPFNRLRRDFNEAVVFDYKYYVMLYVMIVYSFNNQIRFNSEGKFNLPVGKRDFNARMYGKLTAFIERLQSGNYRFECRDFRQIDVSCLTNEDFVYADPPYLITCAAYNENWTETDERDLLNFFDRLNAAGIRFAFSNVLRSKGKENQILADWLAGSRYTTIHLKHSYANSNYHRAKRDSESDEVLVVNYDGV